MMMRSTATNTTSNHGNSRFASISTLFGTNCSIQGTSIGCGFFSEVGSGIGI